jgi:hypothetical protein
MRLTLRTLLASLDGVLTPEDQSEVAGKIADSSFARELVARIGHVIAKRGLGGRLPVVPTHGILPEKLASYLENTLPAEEVAGLEQIMLTSDAELAEVAACHQILAVALGEPVNVDPNLRTAIYGIQFDQLLSDRPILREPATDKSLSAPPEDAARPDGMKRSEERDRAFQKHRIFVSHSSLDRRFVEEEILACLGQHGIEFWFAEDSILMGDHWERDILAGLRSCNWFLLVMSPRSANSEWVKDELHFAISQLGGSIIPVMIDDCDPYEFHVRIARIQMIDMRSDRDRAKRRLLETILKRRLLPTDSN